MSDYRIGRLNGRFVVSWWVDGKRKRYRLDALTAKDAEREAIDVIRQEVVSAEPVTVKILWDMYREEKKERRVATAMKFEWKAIGPHFGHLRPDQITTDICRAYTAKRRATMLPRGKDAPPRPVHDGTIWTELGHLRTVMVWAANRKHLIAKAPDIERPQKPAAKDRWLTDAEIGKLLEAKAAPHIRLAILLMLSTAARVGAVLDLTWDRVDFESGVINLRASTTGPRKGRAVVPMNAGLKAALSAAKEAALTDYVVEWAGEQVASIKTGFNAAVKDAGLTGVSPHVLRHTAAVHLAVAGTPMSRIAQYLGHTSTAVTERVYARFAPEHLREEANILDFTSKPRLVGTKGEG
ncbi:site-specific integrase [Devosia sp. 2618]|uniref:tyrosine-type recombinase/integrase n=1 Tax=Devosia sp. 2618 TaxID=3156454 RepID=UPI00339B7B0D